jgi:hypothetical protein
MRSLCGRSEKRAQLFHTITNVYAPHLPCQSGKDQACVFLGRNCCHVLREIPALSFVISALKRIAADSLDTGAQVALNIQCIPHTLATSFMQVIDQGSSTDGLSCKSLGKGILSDLRK